MKTKGLLVFVYKNGVGDCTAKGISHDKQQLILVGPGIPEIFEGDETNTVELLKRNVFGVEHLHVKPLHFEKGPKHMLMCGGNFVYSSDSRFPSKQPISIHDRYEGG
jgi:hypothetical protein